MYNQSTNNEKNILFCFEYDIEETWRTSTTSWSEFTKFHQKRIQNYKKFFKRHNFEFLVPLFLPILF